ncbi:MAG: amidohydrolase family protein [Balneolaceae bacterium]|nr:amidohydrolase family protein [Balneolaceae bacterium]
MKSAIRFSLFAILLAGLVTLSRAQSDQEPDPAPAKALDNVTIHLSDGRTVSSGTVVWRDGILVAVGRRVEIPFDAFVIDGGDSLHVYPGFVDGLALWGSPDLPESYETPERPGEPGYERAGIQSHRQPSDLLKTGDRDLVTAQKTGFTTAVLGLKGQMLPGQLDLFFLNGEQTGDHLYRESLALHAQFEEAPGSFGNGAYPATLMGIMAELRQLWYDATALKTQAAYYASSSDNYPAPDKDEVLESLFPVIDGEQPLYFVVDTRENIERLFWLKDELGFDLVIVSGREAHEQTDELARRNIPVLASIDLPEKPEWKVKQEEAAESKEEPEPELEEVTEEMRIFRVKQLAAYRSSLENIHSLLEAGVKVGYSSNGMDLGDFHEKITALIEETEITEREVLAMLTRNTADILGEGSRLGDLQKGKIASFSVFTKPFSEENSKVKYSVSNGKITEFELEESNSTKE